MVLRKLRRILTLFALSALIMVVAITQTLMESSVTLPPTPRESIQRLGNPLLDDGHSGRALNVWDLQTYQGKVYLAGGSTISNSGPINVWAYDPRQQKFIQEFTVEEEAIEHYKILNGQLYIPASDPTKGDRHKFYRRESDGQWHKYESEVIRLAHVRDLLATEDNEILLVGNHRRPDRPDRQGISIATANNNGFTFAPAGVSHVLTKGVTLVDFNWFFAIFKYQNRIYATNSLLRDADNYQGAIAEYNPTTQEFVLNFKLRNDELIPPNWIDNGGKYGLDVIYRPWKPVEFQGYLVYPVRSYSTSPHNYRQAYMNSLGFFYKSSMGHQPKELKLPGNAIGEDVLIINNQLYVLGNYQQRDNNYQIAVFKTENLTPQTEWQELVKFSSPNKARSFAYLAHTFYFGLGQDFGEAINSAGEIISYSLD